jgi:HK97 family phage portal protein
VGLAERVLTRESAPTEEQRAMQVTPWGQWNNTAMGSAAGQVVSTDASLQLLTVYGATQLIADTIATLPRDVFRKNNDGTNEEVTNPPRWLEHPNPDTDIIEFLTQTLVSLLLDGNAYWAYGLDGNVQPSVLYVLNPIEVEVRVGQPRSLGTVPPPEYWIRGQRYGGKLLHIKGITRPGSMKGLSPVEAARQSLGVGLAEQDFHGNFFKNGATLSAVIEVPGVMTQEQARQLRENISRTHGGTANAHLPGVITNGGKWNTVSVTPEQAEFLASRKYDDGAICSRMFLLDPTWLGIPVEGQSLTYANLEQRGIQLAQFTLMRWIIRIERAATLLLPRPQFLKLNVNALQRADLKTRMEAHRIALGPTQPFETVNEVREFEDLPPMVGFDDLKEQTQPQPSLAVPSMNGTKQPVGVT